MKGRKKFVELRGCGGRFRKKIEGGVELNHGGPFGDRYEDKGGAKDRKRRKGDQKGLI